MTRHPGGCVLSGAAVAAVAGAYWTTMSPYSQLVGPFPYRTGAGHRSGTKTIALTFDDGPNEPFTSQIATVLDERDIKGTFFQVGRCVERHPDSGRRLIDSGHVVGNHSFAHRFDRCWTERAITEEIRLSQEVLQRALGREPALYRPPWLARTPATFRVLREAGLHAVSGEFCHALEPFQPGPRRIARRALAKAQAGGILIFHDGYDARGADRSSTVEAVKIAVDALITRGYSFTTVDHLLGLPPYAT